MSPNINRKKVNEHLENDDHTLNPLNIAIGTIIADPLKYTISRYSDAISMKLNRKCEQVTLVSLTLY